MSAFQERLAAAIKLREAESHGEARQLLLELQTEFPEDPQVNYQCAWIHDLLGLEKEAIPFYEKAIQAGLSGDDLKSALLGLGSTYRCIGEYQKSIGSLQGALALFPDNQEFNVFLAMAYYNISRSGNNHGKPENRGAGCARTPVFGDSFGFREVLNIGDYSKAMELLLNSLADTSVDEGILRYRRAIRFYSDKLDQIW